MDKATIKTYATTARRKLIESVKLKARQLYIFEDCQETLRPGEESGRLQADGIFLSSEQLRARERLYAELLHEDIPYKPAIFNRVMEDVACTWFNRLIALRIMEVNGWLPSNIRILSSYEPGRAEPDAMREATRLDYVSQSKIAELSAETGINASEKLYKYILISQCNALSNILPSIFEKENDYTELLLPDALLSKGGIVHDLVNTIHEDNFNIEKQGQIEIIGWLYQFYISEKKDEVFAGLKKNIKINKDTIPAATQLFTPEWIVKYMVENSLGRLWLDNHPNEELKSKWKYYVDEAEQEPEVAEQLRVLRSQSPVKRPEDIKLIDPCMGSGHILVYAFDVLFQIYQSEGYSEREIPNLILQNNIFGLDIDDRAFQLSYFALMIKARSYNRRFFRQESIPQPKVYAFLDRKWFIVGVEKWLGVSMEDAERKICYDDLYYLADILGDAKGKTFGSTIKIERKIDFEQLRKYIHDFASEQVSWNDTDFVQQAEYFDRLIDIAELLAQKYDVVVTNPPYMAPAPSQADWVKKNYPNSKSDLCVVFIERNFELLKQNGYLSMITMHSWMFLSSYEKFREKLIGSKDIVNMVHLGARAFEEIGGEVVQTTAFAMRQSDISGYLGAYVRLVDYAGQQVKEDAFLRGDSRYTANKENFEKIPGWRIAYWLKANRIFDSSLIENIFTSAGRNKTHDNELFVRLWWECNKQAKYWMPYANGGNSRKWYGNKSNVVNWSDFAKSEYAKHGGLIPQKSCDSFGVTWNGVSGNNNAFRIKEAGMSLSSSAPTIISDNENLVYHTIGFLNSKPSDYLLKVLNPTLQLNVGEVLELPLIQEGEAVEKLVRENISISRTDWDSFETSWDFKQHPLIAFHPFTPQRNQAEVRAGYHVTNTMEETFECWQSFTNEQFAKLKSNEEELNCIFIEIYGLQDELTPEVEDKDVTIRKADLSRDIRSFISYAVGCMFGRYSLDEPGLVFAGGEFDISRYKTFKPEDDNNIPIGSADYFDDDIVVRFIEFVRVVYGDNTLNENLNFIADALYPNASGSAQERIRRYFLNDFYKDHVKIYQKRPIYWLMDSGKKDGFKALFYLHRYDKYTVARARTDYMHPLQRKYEAEIKRLDMLSGSTDDVREKAIYRKDIDMLQAQIDECRVYDQVMSHIAHQQIELDLDDGVKVNYGKFQGVTVPKDNGKTETMDLLAKI